MIKVCVVDDHAVIRGGVKRIISQDPEMAVTAEAGYFSGRADGLRPPKNAEELLIANT